MLDLTAVVMGPLATQILGDLGADVISVENRQGDVNRVMSAGPVRGLSGVALNLLRNKRNIAVDLGHPDGRAALLRVAETCDVFVTNLRPGSLAGLGLAYSDIRQVRPDVVFCQACGYPSDGPDADEPAFDDIIQAASGVPDALGRAATGTGPDAARRQGVRPGRRVLDHGRAVPPRADRAGPAGRDPMTEAIARSSWSSTAGRPSRSAGTTSGYRDPDPAPPSAGDRGRLDRLLAVKTTAEWLAFCSVTGSRPAGGQPGRVDRRASAGGAPGGRELPADPAAGRFSATPASARLPAPLPGQHTREVLAEARATDAEITALEQAGLLHAAERPSRAEPSRAEPTQAGS